MYLAVALAKLDDVDNASAAYEKAIELNDDMMFRLNYGKLSVDTLAEMWSVVWLCTLALAENRCQAS